MKVQLKQSGGFMGMLKECTLDTHALEPEEADTIRDSVNRTDWNLVDQDSERNRDGYHYYLLVEDQQQTYSAEYTDETLPESLKPLIGVLKRYLKAGRF